jgi:hypothetical protein
VNYIGFTRLVIDFLEIAVRDNACSTLGKINLIVHVVHSENIPRADNATEIQLHLMKYQTPVTQLSIIVCWIDKQ